MYEQFASEAIGKRVNFLFRITMRHIRGEMKKIGIGASDYSFIFILFFKEGLSQDEMSKIMYVDKSYTARALARLEKLGMVERRPDPDEHRVKRVYLCEKARDLEDDIFRVLMDWQQVLVKDIEHDEFKIIRDGLDKMLDNARSALGYEDPSQILGKKS
ncbi:MAG: MarR family transcriptional regulator [Desulfobacterales bacterium]|nr:MarR family transcriptional regulator [Desulfobacterales bacterium]